MSKSRDIASGTFVELTTSSTLDVNGNELILDADADTSITADTDDQIDIKVGGTDSISITPSRLEFPIGSDIEISQVAGTAHQASNAGSIALTIADGGGHSGIFVNNSHDGTYSDQFITFKTAEGGISSATERMRIDSSGNLKFNSGYGSAATAYGCRAWVNFNGTGAVAIRDSGNVSSITDLGTGQYQVNFTTAMPDVNYAIVFSGYGNSARNTTTANISTSSAAYLFVYTDSTSTFIDAGSAYVAVFR